MLSLFDDSELFTPGNPGHRVFDLPDAELVLYEGFFTKPESDLFYGTLLAETPWKEFEMHIYDKSVKVPRMVVWYEDKSNTGADPDGLDWTPTLLEIRKRVEEGMGRDFNSVLLNLYRNGNDGVSWHSDREHTIGKNPVIASLSFGQTRLFRLRHKISKQRVEIPLHHGSLLLISGTTNTFWEHEVPKTAKPMLPRINLTFRVAKRLP